MIVYRVCVGEVCRREKRGSKRESAVFMWGESVGTVVTSWVFESKVQESVNL